MTSIPPTRPHARPSTAPAYVLTTVGPWAAALAAGRCAGDDLLDELLALEMPTTVLDAQTGATIGWLELARRAQSFSVRLPAPGDPAGLPPGPASAAAFTVGEALVVETDADVALIVPERDPDRAPAWMSHALPTTTAAPPIGPGEARAALLDAIGEATSVLAALPGVRDTTPTTLRTELAAQVTRFTPLLPPGADARAVDVAGLAAQVLGTIALADARLVKFGIASSHAQDSADQLRGLTTVARGTLAAAVNRVIVEYQR
ncbi:MAG TPA: hypothetical protein PK331_17405 [Gordonia sp. (in: high G+C Gram-positive bacteria)]|uniref:hypothetical protein n=1 Tax=unclassified Gordonia (in: high G+C Gram-positive bacteria) TaxID=2657482 RepID=UPI0025C62908|nr:MULTISPECIES: hypothetical protein [unclassified Gordonia (in: high G+C Gram-positive bacteria)]HNP55783.1 hypothetical protein [Gordonia sp. (in: high G+C Gram-positive bacteria)]HRC52683.1 hypothetical protein [Gordonia sp. (in: high G+C Gram-positive bacteria)]